MSKVLWLDNRPAEIERGVTQLLNAGHQVIQCQTEDEVVEVLEGNSLPDILIQDLHRPQRARRTGGTPTTAHQAGWHFYSDFLKPLYPQMPVLICSYDAHVAGNLIQADDFNLVSIAKRRLVRGEIAPTVECIVSARSTVHSSISIPAVIGVDFSSVNMALIRHLAKKPADIHQVSWSSFEELVARLLQELGYEIFHTPLTRDGGVDLWAIHRNDLGETLYAIDAKKYAPSRLVGPEPVRAIYGVADLSGASAGMIVTTGRFGPAALDLASQYRYRIALRDFKGIVEWIRTVAGFDT